MVTSASEGAGTKTREMVPYFTIPLLIFLLATALKLLLVPSYHSTDFEVHRNWMAVTHSLPLEKWYFEDTSPHTLDYPPFFAWFEWGLSFLAKRVDPMMVKISRDAYVNDRVVLFQRVSVMVTDVVLLLGVLAHLHLHQARGAKRSSSGTGLPSSWPLLLSVLVLFNPGLLLVDHMHFQYNGMLLGLLLLSTATMQMGHEVVSGVLFATLLMFKHLFLSLAPIYFIYLLRHYCHFAKGKNLLSSFSLPRFTSLGASVLGVFLLALGPFVVGVDGKGQLLQMLARLFPFGRGLVHAYWAPNAYALYCFTDTALAAILRRAGRLGPSLGPTWASGLVQEIEPEVLPVVTPAMALTLSLMCMVPAMVLAWRREGGPVFTLCLFHACLSTYMFGWHVHEKAILVALLVLAPLSLQDKDIARLYFRLSTVGHFSLLPLFFQPGSFEALAKSSIFLTGTIATYSALQAATQLTLTLLDIMYLIGLSLVWLFVEVIHPALLAPRWAFLPLMAVSVYCSLGTVEATVASWRALVRRGGVEGSGGETEGVVGTSSGMTTRARSKEKAR